MEKKLEKNNICIINKNNNNKGFEKNRNFKDFFFTGG